MRTPPHPQAAGTAQAPGTIRADVAHAEAGQRRARVMALSAGLLGAVAAAAFVCLWVWRLAFAGLPPVPPARVLWSLNRPPGATFLDRNGRVIGRRGSYHGPPLSLSDLPPYVPAAFLAAEDRRFYAHRGVDLEGVARAARDDLLGRKGPLEGGSTITQQIVRTLFLGPDQTLRRKAQEAVLALELEGRLSKTQILELYLNRIYFGAGAYGLEAASETYFGTSARRLTLAEAVFLASLPKAPGRFSAEGGPAAAAARARLVLQTLEGGGAVTPAQAAEALSHPAVLARQSRSEGVFGFILDLAAREARLANTNAVPDLVVRLSVDARLQEAAAAAVAEAVAEGQGVGARQAALIALGADGDVLALVGGADHRLSPFDRATQALRQPGSAFKPFVYAAALDAGLTPEDVRTDGPVRVGAWRPTNAEGTFAGPVTLRTALARSLNTVAVRVSQEVGPDKVAALARRFGLSAIPPRPAPPIALGAYETSLIDLTSAYQVFQHGGRRLSPFLILEVRNARGDLIYARPATPPAQVYDAGRAAMITDMMRGVITGGTGRQADIGRPAAGKTGTSQDYRDAWFIGFTPDLAAGVWMGDDHGRPMSHVAGGDLPARTWRRFMLEALKDSPPKDFPAVATLEVTSRGNASEGAQSEETPPKDPPLNAADPGRTAFYTRLAAELKADEGGEPAAPEPVQRQPTAERPPTAVGDEREAPP